MEQSNQLLLETRQNISIICKRHMTLKTWHIYHNASTYLLLPTHFSTMNAI